MSNSVSLLQAVTHRLNHTPVKELPHIASFLATSIRNCAGLLTGSSDQATGKKDDLAIQFQKLKARLTSLLQDQTVQGRFTAIVLIKVTVEAGGRNTLSSCEPWLRGLLVILNKQDPPSSKKLCLLTITRIFSLTQPYPTLLREMTTPLLPAFLTACLSLGGVGQLQGYGAQAFRPSPYLETVLQCILHLMPYHPSIFRPFVPKLRAGLAFLNGGRSSPGRIDRLAQSVLVTLHCCAPKNAAGDEWLKACQGVVTSIHEIADEIFRAVSEDWETSDGGHPHYSTRKEFDQEARGTGGGPLGIPPWQGVYQGSRVLMSLVHLLQSYLRTPTVQAVDVPVGAILDLTSRLTCARMPGARDAQSLLRFNSEITRGERDELLAVLPEINQSALELLSTIVIVLGRGVVPAAHTILDQCLWIARSESSNEDVYVATYDLLSHLMPILGPSMTKERFKPLVGAISSCCRHISSATAEHDHTQGSAESAIDGHADSFVQSGSKKQAKVLLPFPRVAMVASGLLCRVLTYIPAPAIPHSVRAQIDSTAILGGHKQTMLASVLNPPSKISSKWVTPSLLPFLARTSQDQLYTESLLRPRMPLVEGNAVTNGLDAESIDEDEVVNHEDFGPPKEGNGSEQEAQVDASVIRSEGQNDILDKLEDLIGSGVAVKPDIVHVQETGSHDNFVNVVLEQDQNSGTYDSLQGSKRNYNGVDAEAEETRVKCLRATGDHVEQEVAVPLAETLVDTKAVGVATEVSIPNSAVLPGVAGDTAGVDKERAPATDVFSQQKAKSPWDGGVGGHLSDDESDFEMPTLYLKTSSEEEEEYIDDGYDDDEAEDEGRVASDAA